MDVNNIQEWKQWGVLNAWMLNMDAKLCKFDIKHIALLRQNLKLV